MKCKLCNEKRGSARCEGCNISLCLSCMNKHHNELLQHFQQLMNVRNELKESFATAEIVLQNEEKLPCIIEINQWEQKTIENIQATARKIRTNIKEIMSKNMAEIRYQLEQLSVNMQQQEKEENYLENDMEEIKHQLNQLKETLEHINEKIHIITSKNVNWDALIHIKTDKNLSADTFNFCKTLIQESNNDNNVQTNQEKRSNRTLTSRQLNNNNQSIFRPTIPRILQSDDSKSFRPIPSQNYSFDSDNDSPLNQDIIPFDRIISMPPNNEQLHSWRTVTKNT